MPHLERQGERRDTAGNSAKNEGRSSDIHVMELVRVTEIITRRKLRPKTEGFAARLFRSQTFRYCLRIAVFVTVFLAVLLLFPQQAS